MNTTELMRYFEMVIDESDNTFVNAADKALFLTLGPTSSEPSRSRRRPSTWCRLLIIPSPGCGPST